MKTDNLLTAVLLMLALIVLPHSPASAQVPQKINYQGYLASNTGVPVNTTVQMAFRLWDTPTAGTQLWAEVQPSVAVTNGVFNVVLGSNQPLNLPFSTVYYLGVTAGSDGEMTPRQALAASPYALRAQTADGLSGTATVQGSQITGAINSATISGAALTQLQGQFLGALQPTSVAANIITSVDTAVNVGQYTSITIGADGLPVISHYGNTNQDLKVAKCGNAACSAGNTVTSVDTVGNVGQYTSITIGADALPVISYYDFTNGDLKVSKCGNAACSTGNTITAVDTAGNVGQYSSITIGADGLPVISYYDVTNLDLKVAKCGNAACSTGNTVTTVDTAGDVGQYTSITIGADGLPVISYYDLTNGNLKVAKCGSAACSAGNTITTVDGNAAVDVVNLGLYTSIAIGTDGLPAISYFDFTNLDLKVTKCGNAACSAGNTITALDTAGGGGSDTSIAIGADGLPVISYLGSNADLKFAKCGNAACSAGNTSTAVDTTGNVGLYTSVTIGMDGLPLISYYYANAGDLRVAKCANAFCSPYFRRR